MDTRELMEKLTLLGADIQGIRERFMDDDDFYASCFVAFTKDRTFSDLARAMEQHAYREAFNTAHSLKGLTANMGLTPLSARVSELVEALRAEQRDLYNEKYAAVVDIYNEIRMLA